MVRKISFRNNRKPPRDQEGWLGTETDASTPEVVSRRLDQSMREQRKYQRLVNDDLRRDLAEVSKTSPDLRDRVSHVSTGESRQRIAHRKDFVPDILSWRVVHDSDETYTVNEWRDADDQFLFVKTNAPKGARLILILSERNDP